jgi:parallel beta-helix repeat protein
MADRTTLKSYFQAGDIPTEAQFAAQIDSLALQSDLLATAATANAAWSDVAGARGGYSTLGARLDSFVLSGGNLSTLTDGPTSAGQPVVNVDSASGFIPGARVAYKLATGVIEYNVIASILSNAITHDANIGGAVEDGALYTLISESEYQAANANPHGPELTLDRAVRYAGRAQFNVMAYGAKGDGATDDTDVIQDAIDAAETAGGGDVVFPGPAVYRAANILLKSGVNLIGSGPGVKIKVLDNANEASHNGSVIDAFGYYPATGITTVLGYFGQGQDRANAQEQDPDARTYYVENVLIENMEVDGNRANNSPYNNGDPEQGEGLHNRSALHACIVLNCCKNITVRNCVIHDGPLDGIFVGFAEYGGGDYCTVDNCYIYDNNRVGVVLEAGQYNTVRGCTIRHAGTGVGIDIEGDIATTINWRHKIVDNPLIENGIASASPTGAYQHDCLISGNTIKTDGSDGVTLGSPAVVSGTVVDSNMVLGTSYTGNAIALAELASSATYYKPVVFQGNTFAGFERIRHTAGVGSVGHVVLRGNVFQTKFGATLYYPYKVVFDSNLFRFTGGEGAGPAFTVVHSQGATITLQGEVKFVNNIMRGDGVTAIILSSRAETVTNSPDLLTLQGNDIDMTVSGAYDLDINHACTLLNNRFRGISGSSGFLDFGPYVANSRIIGNVLVRATGGSLVPAFNNTTSAVGAQILRNSLEGLNLYLLNPRQARVQGNTIYNGKVNVVFAGSLANMGGSAYIGNHCFADTTVDYAWDMSGTVNVSGWLDEVLEGNSHAGSYTNRSRFHNGTMIMGSNTWYRREMWAASAPSGTWTVGDVCWNTGAAAGGTPGWVYTAGGWKAMANVAA